MTDEERTTRARADGHRLYATTVTRKEFEAIYQAWYGAVYTWQVHLGLLMSPHLTAQEFLSLYNRYQGETAVREECLAQIRCVAHLSAPERQMILGSFLPPPDRREQPETWSMLERLAMARL